MSPAPPPSAGPATTAVLTEADVLRAIGDLLTAKRSAAALAHYPTLRIQTNNLNVGLERAILVAGDIVDRWSEDLSLDVKVASEFQAATAPLFPYRLIAPMLMRNVHQTSAFLLEEAQGTPAVDTNRAGETTLSFSDFVKLGASVRGFVDALVQAAYQLVTFDGRQLNYKFLQSLLSFATVVPPSLHANIVSPEMQAALDA